VSQAVMTVPPCVVMSPSTMNLRDMDQAPSRVDFFLFYNHGHLSSSSDEKPDIFFHHSWPVFL
jgi:hypothetical protein